MLIKFETQSNPYPDIQPFFNIINPIPNKNYGGCLFFCYAFWLWMNKNNLNDNSFYIVQYDKNEDFKSIKNNLKWIEDKNNIPSSSYHFSWMYKNIEFDAEGRMLNLPFYHKEILPISSNLFELFFIKALNLACWNNLFNRQNAIQELEKKLNINLSKVKNQIQETD